jgi:GT2 family glycosyltransferase
MTPKCSIIISVYKDTQSLDLIFQSLVRQTRVPDEVIISEDGNAPQMKDFVEQAQKTYPTLTMLHLFQEDLGWRKNIALNRAILASNNDYLMFIDGDCVPFDDFVENHLLQAQHGIVLCGKRTELGPNLTQKIYDKKLDIGNLTRHYFRYLPWLIADKTRHLEDMFHIHAKSFLAKFLKRNVRYIIGCNWSAFKEDILKINGFDETYKDPSVGEDIDLGWRFRGLGIELLSCKFNANLVHLYHKKRFNSDIMKKNDAILMANFKLNKFFCDNGIIKHTSEA